MKSGWRVLQPLEHSEVCRKYYPRRRDIPRGSCMCSYYNKLDARRWTAEKLLQTREWAGSVVERDPLCPIGYVKLHHPNGRAHATVLER